MDIRLHVNATTTPKTHGSIRFSSKGIQALVHKLEISVGTARHWRGRDEVKDRPHTRKNLLATLSEAEEAIIIELRRTQLLPLDDFMAVAREFIHPEISRPALDRCLRRNGVSRLANVTPAEPWEAVKTKPFSAYESGYTHIDHNYPT